MTLGIYVHIPFCLQKCSYCDFLSFTNINDYQIQTDYTHALLNEIEYWGQEISGEGLHPSYRVDTLFMGGGTPTVLDIRLMDRIMSSLHRWFSIEKNAEITLEANPGTVTNHILRDYKNMGINRLSIGVQSLKGSVLSTLGRIHDGREALESVEKARKAGFNNVNVDLMFGIPGQGMDDWQNTLKGVLDRDPDHVSFYGLQVEAGTTLYRKIQSGKLVLPPWEEDRAMYQEGIKTIEDRGYVHYEISNGAKPGKESRHNLKYWSMDEYLGLGLGAHSFLNYKNGGFVRFSNDCNMEGYIKSANPYHMPEPYYNTEKDNISEYIFTGLRKMEGIRIKSFEERFNKPFFQLYADQIRKFTDLGLLKYDEKSERLALTLDGIDVSNQVLAAFV
ncbi:MAG: radical SAM family heme chaperone HemW [Anaerovoracaceae bacterium]